MRTINDWDPETRSLLVRLLAAGFEITHGDNGEFEFVYKPGAEGLDQFIKDLTACDESRLYLRWQGRTYWLFLVFGNSPGELVSDYTVSDALDNVVETHGQEWENRPQPKKEEA